MRVLTTRRLDGHGEEGVTAIIVVLSLVALFGMMVLVVDVGGLLFKRREMVNTADAAALAAAKTCVTPLDLDGRTPEQAAEKWAAQNSANAELDGITTSGCRQGEGYVSVQYSADQGLFFAPVLGFSNSGQVTTAATAIFGAAGGSNPLPLVMYRNAFNDCKLDNDPIPGNRCYIWEDNDNTGTSQSGFGFLDLRLDPGDVKQYGWNTENRLASCPNVGNDLKEWIENYPDPDVGDRAANYPAATWVCLSRGGNEAAWGNDIQRDGPMYDLIDTVVVLPLNRCYTDPEPTVPDGQLDSKGMPAPCGVTPWQYDIVGFGAVRVIDIYAPKDAVGDSGPCANKPFEPFDADGDIATGQSFSLASFGLFEGQCFSVAPDNIPASSVVIAPSQGGGPDYVRCADGQASGCDYRFDETDMMVTWVGPSTTADGSQEGQDDLRISFNWRNLGPCGFVPEGTTVNNAGHCMVVEVVRIKLGGSSPGLGDPDSNVYALKLCDENVKFSCDPITVP